MASRLGGHDEEVAVAAAARAARLGRRMQQRVEAEQDEVAPELEQLERPDQLGDHARQQRRHGRRLAHQHREQGAEGGHVAEEDERLLEMRRDAPRLSEMRRDSPRCAEIVRDAPRLSEKAQPQSCRTPLR